MVFLSLSLAKLVSIYVYFWEAFLYFSYFLPDLSLTLFKLFLFVSTNFIQFFYHSPTLKQCIYQKPKLSMYLGRCRARSAIIHLQPEHRCITRLWAWWNIHHTLQTPIHYGILVRETPIPQQLFCWSTGLYHWCCLAQELHRFNADKFSSFHVS